MNTRKVAVVTGGASGIGRACAQALAGKGYSVAILDVNAEGAHNTVAAVQEAGGTALYLPCDVADAEAVEACAQTIANDWGTADVVVTCAALIPNTESLLDMDAGEHDR